MPDIFMDESGDLGFNFSKGKTSHNFVITIVYFDNPKKINKIINKIHKQKKIVKPKTTSILHAYKETKQIRLKVLESIAKEPVKIMCICLNKKKVYTNLQNEQNLLYNYVTNILLDRIQNKDLLPENKDVNLIASRKNTNKFLNENFKSYLENGSIRNKLKIKVQTQTPHQNKCLQATDFLSWALFRKHEHGDETYYNVIKNIIIEEGWLYK